MVTRELELKLIADATFEEAALVRHLATFARVGEPTEQIQRDAYLDTPSGELAAAGLSARVRHVADARTIEVKPVPIDPGLIRDRAELTAKVEGGCEPAETLREMLAGRLGLRLRGDPAVVVRLQTRRRRIDVTAAAFEAELCVDDVQIDGGGSFREVELELSSGDASAFREVARTFVEVAGLEPSRHSKVQRARASVGLPPFRYDVDAPPFDEGTPIGEVARGVGSALFRTMLGYEPGTRVGLDPEHLHKMRVAIRRLRTALRVFRRAFVRGERKAFGRELRWLGRVLGEVRDLDVHQLELPQWIARFGPAPGDGWAALEQALTRRRDEARVRLLDALDDPRCAALGQRADALFGNDREATAWAKQPAREAGSLVVAEAVDAFHEAVDAFRETHAVEDAHRLRIVGKRLRYTARFLEPLLGDRAKARVGALATFQDRLGALQDVVARGELAYRLSHDANTAAHPDPAYLHVLGLLGGAAAMAKDTVRPVVDAALDELDPEGLFETLKP